jgi:Flp pilus assembly protein TadG
VALVANTRRSRHTWRRARRSGQALVEAAVVIPMLLLLAFGIVAVGRVVQAQMGVSAVAREASRAAALANDPAEAVDRGIARGQTVGTGYRLSNGSLQIAVDSGGFTRGERVRASASYQVSLVDLPLLGAARITVTSDHFERVDLYRSRWPTGD